jgi:hypothetical protein
LQAQQLLSAQHADGNVLKIRSVRMLARWMLDYRVEQPILRIGGH